MKSDDRTLVSIAGAGQRWSVRTTARRTLALLDRLDEERTELLFEHCDECPKCTCKCHESNDPLDIYEMVDNLCLDLPVRVALRKWAGKA